MKHLKKFNENKSEMQLEDYFVEFIDEGFTIERKLNEFKLKYTGEYDFNQALEMYNDVITKLQAYGKDITKTEFSYKKFVTNIIIEVKNNIKEGVEIEIELRGEKLKLIPNAFQLYGNSTTSLTYPDLFISCITLFCKDENNQNYNIQWDGGNYNKITEYNVRAKVRNTNIRIDLKSTKKVFDIIKNNKIESRNTYNIILDIFSKVITPELLVR
jgi:hypothetical protein